MMRRGSFMILRICRGITLIESLSIVSTIEEILELLYCANSASIVTSPWNAECAQINTIWEFDILKRNGSEFLVELLRLKNLGTPRLRLHIIYSSFAPRIQHVSPHGVPVSPHVFLDSLGASRAHTMIEGHWDARPICTMILRENSVGDNSLRAKE